ncbi:tetratricopeptide repeat protein [Nocardia vaccinii]|uniref:tetratricopeptide repeat protein n=1 Tax=Nocardia vaccinii TaxID=1822 RepID=UPI00082D9569|nr:tetratricopeptide repeat protein [Nocardia vaccinii]
MADLERAKVLVELRRLTEAREQLAAVLAAEPDNAEAATYLAQAAYLDQRYREAAEQSAAALRIQPRNQFAMRIHALALLNTGDAGRRQAQQVARQVVALGPEFAENHRILAIVLRECGDLPEALVAIDRAVELDPDEADIHVARGSILRRMGQCGTRFRPGPAAEAYHVALRLEPESAYAVHDLAIVELNGHRLRNALRGVLKAATMEPGLGDLVRTNVATVVRHALRRMHWVLVAVAFVTLVLGGFRLPPSAVPAGSDTEQAVYKSHDYPAPQPFPVGQGTDPAGLPASAAPSLPETRASVAAPGAATQEAGSVTQAPSPGPSSAHVPGAAEPHGPGVSAGADSSVARDPAHADPQTTANRIGGQGDSATTSSARGESKPANATRDSSSATTHDPARLETPARVAGAVGFGMIVAISLWWLGAVPRRRWRFVLRAAWASPPTAVRLAVFGVGLVVCVLGVATGMRVFLSVGEPTLVALGIILRRIA